MAKSNAARCRAYRQRMKERQAEQQEVMLDMPLPAGTARALDVLMQWADHTDPRETIATLIHRLHESGRDTSLPFLNMSRHEYTPSETMLRRLEEYRE